MDSGFRHFTEAGELHRSCSGDWGRTSLLQLSFLDRVFQFLRSDRFHFYGLGWNSHHDVKWLHVLYGDTAGTDQSVLAYFYSAHHGCVIGDASLGPDFGLVIVHDHAVIQIVGVGVNVGVVGDGTAFMYDDLSAIVEQHVFMDGAVVL